MNSLALYDLARRIVNLGDFSKPISESLAATREEKVIDIGCGTGGYAKLAPGRYVGADPDPRRIGYARSRHGGPDRVFHASTVSGLTSIYPAKHFHKGMMVNVLHHLSDSLAREELAAAASLVRERFI